MDTNSVLDSLLADMRGTTLSLFLLLSLHIYLTTSRIGRFLSAMFLKLRCMPFCEANATVIENPATQSSDLITYLSVDEIVPGKAYCSSFV